MSLSQALSTALTGLRTTQAGLALVASNVANAQTPGYIRKTLVQAPLVAGNNGGGVRVAAVSRELDLYVERQLRVELSGGGFATTRANFYQRLQQLYGAPGSDSALETVFNNFTNAVQGLVTSPDATANRSAVLSSAQVLAQQLNSVSGDIQALRGDAESGLADAVTSANDALQKIATINRQLANSTGASGAEATLQDQRDLYVNQLSDLMDIRVVVGEHNEYKVFTNSGIQLVGAEPTQLVFNAQGTMSPFSQYSADRNQSTLSTLSLQSSNGATIDLIANDAIRSGKIAALIDMRDNVLTQAQDQLDAMAAAMAHALSDVTTNGTAIPPGPQSGFDIDTAGLLAGNTLSLTYTDRQTNQQHTLTLIRVDDPTALPLKNSMTADPNDQVIGMDFSGGLTGAMNQLNQMFAGNLQFSATGTVLHVRDDGASNRTDIDALSMTTSASGLTGGTALPFFTDATNLFTGSITSRGPQQLGFAERIAVNPALLADPSKLVAYMPGIGAGDPTRPNYIYQQLTAAKSTFLPATGIGSTAVPFTSDVPTFLRQMLSMQGQAADNANSLSQGQSVVVNALQQRINDNAGVNVDQEMANLLALQNAYGANARVMSAIKDMLDTLMRI